MRKLFYGKKRIEYALSGAGAEIALAAEKVCAARQLCEESNQLLMAAQTRIADLYESLEEILDDTKRRD